MNKKLIYSESIIKTEDDIPWYKELRDSEKREPIYEEDNHLFNHRVLFI